MNVAYIQPFTEAAFNILKEVLNEELSRGELSLKFDNKIQGVAALVGLAGDVEGRVLIDMTKETAIHVAEVMNQDKFEAFDEMAKATIQELANMITARAITSLHEHGFKFDLTPPALFVGENMEVSSTKTMEALVVPVELSTGGRIDINVAIREKVK